MGKGSVKEGNYACREHAWGLANRLRLAGDTRLSARRYRAPATRRAHRMGLRLRSCNLQRAREVLVA